jgi:hypothetical protein
MTVVDQTDSVEAQLAGGIEIIELDHVRAQEHLCGRHCLGAPIRLIGAATGVGCSFGWRPLDWDVFKAADRVVGH